MKKLLCTLACVTLAIAASAQGIEGIGVHGGVGTDVQLGLGVGGGASILLPNSGRTPIEVGLDFYYSNTSVTTHSGTMNYAYTDDTVLSLFAVTADWLYSYEQGRKGIFYIAGIGAAGANVSWTHSSPQDTTYNDSGSYTGGGLLAVPGIGYAFGTGLELRLQLPILVVFGETTLFSPMLNLVAGYRFP